MNLFSLVELLQLTAWFLALLEFILALYVLLLNAWHTANRQVCALLLLFASTTFAMGLLFGATYAEEAFLPTAFLAAATPAVSFGLLIVTIVLLKPAWFQGRGRMLQWTLYGLALWPALLTVIDVGLGTQLWYTGPDAKTYIGGFLDLARYAQGSLAPLIRGLNGFAPLLALIPLIYVAILDRKATPLNRRLARILLGLYLATIAIMFSSLLGLLATGLPTLISSSIQAFAYAYIAFQQMISEQRLQRGRLQVRLTLLILAIALPPLVTTNILVGTRASTQIEADAAERLRTANRLLYTNVSTWQDLNVRALRQLVTLPDIVSMDAGRQKPFLQAMAATYPHMYLVSTTDLHGLNVARSDDLAPKDYSDREWFRGALAGHLTYQIVMGRTSGAPSLVVALPIRNAAQETVGVGMFGAELTTLANLVQASKVGETGVMYVVDNQNLVMVHTDPTITAEIHDFSTYPPVAALRGEGKTGAYDFADHTGTRWRAYIDIMDNGWGVIVQQPEAEVLGALNQIQWIARLALFTGITMLLVLTWLTIRQALRPVGELTATAAAIAAGDLARVAPVESEDEIGALARAFNRMTGRLRELIGTLEQRVADRTRDLERRSAYLEASAEVGRAAAAILEPEELIRQVVDVIRERFGLYYVGLFLVDVTGEWAVLRAGTGEAGQALLARHHRIRVGEGMIGWSVAHGEARVALDVGADAVRLATAELPHTRSEAALPLRSRGRTLGALTVQSDQPAAFDQEAMVVLQTMADQVAVALDNARLFAESQAALDSARRAYGERGRAAWATLLRARPGLGYRSDAQGVTPTGAIWRPEMARAATEGRTVRAPHPADLPGTPLAVPIKVREQVIGVLDTYKPDDAGDWTAEEVALLETISEQVGLALESARLYQDTQRRAVREQLAGEIAARMRETLDVDAVLQTAIREIGQAFGIGRVEVRLGQVPQPDASRESAR